MTTQNVEGEIKQYITIFISLIFLTIVSVGIHYLHLSTGLSIALILTVAITQAALSACYLMHLISERKLIYMVLILTFAFVLGMFLLFYYGYFNHPNGSFYVS